MPVSTGLMLGLGLAKLFTLAQLTVCPPPGFAPKVDLHFLSDKPQYITQAPYKAMTEAFKNNPDSTFETDSKFIVFGLHEGRVSDSGYNVEFRTIYDKAGNTCLNVSRVRIILHHQPTIFLAKELEGHECHFRMVKLHEERHVATDLKTFKEYIPKVEMDILWYLRSLGPQGPFPANEVPQQMGKISAQIAKAAKPMVKKLYAVRRQRQGMIDTLENYRQEAAMCPGELLDIKDIQ